MKRILLCLAALAGIFGASAPPYGMAAQLGLSPLYASGEWLNGVAGPRTLRGKVVVLDVFTFGCYNCRNVTPNLRQLRAQEPANDFAIVGIHAPETPFESNRANLVRNLKLLGITWPVRIDNDFGVWREYGVTAWPTQLIFDRKGKLRKTIVGDSQDADVNAAVLQLLAEH
ncbi:MAG: redoxin domain-containing protein [Candidatus Eremiobacteraeota bacterium]|nr:redoxin domain-containing protein [Candidatus Eremiobacteraeota bacterium]